MLFESARSEGVVVIPFPDLDCVALEVEPIAVPVAPADAHSTEPEWERLLAEARAEAAEEAYAIGEERFRERIEVERSAVAMACASLQRERERYFADMEGEVVRLAMAVAARILHRETAMDPTLLAGIVRHALAQLSDANGAVLAIAADGAERWRAAMKSSSLRVEEDPSLPSGAVQLRASAGVAELGLEAQLVEIERGFFDLLARRPA